MDYLTRPNPLQVSFVPKQLSDVTALIPHHCRSLQTETPGNNCHVFWESHWSEHFWSENSRVSDFDGFLKSWVISEDLHGRLGVRVVGSFELNVSDSDLIEERLDEILELRQSQAVANDETLDLMELSQMS